jgi:hypothetical protein
MTMRAHRGMWRVRKSRVTNVLATLALDLAVEGARQEFFLFIWLFRLSDDNMSKVWWLEICMQTLLRGGSEDLMVRDPDAQVAIHNLASFTAPRTQESFDENFAAQSVTGGKTPLSAEAPEGGSAHLQHTGQQFDSQAAMSAFDISRVCETRKAVTLCLSRGHM